MNDVSKEYGTALFELALESSSAEEYLNALGTADGIFKENPELYALLSSPAISAGQRLEVAESVFSPLLPEQVLSFLLLLCEKGRVSCFEGAYAEYRALYDISQRTVKVQITSVVELTDVEKAKLIARLEETYHCKISPTYSLDPTLLGGIRVELDGRIIDGSIRQRLHEIKEVIE